MSMQPPPPDAIPTPLKDIQTRTNGVIDRLFKFHLEYSHLQQNPNFTVADTILQDTGHYIIGADLEFTKKHPDGMGITPEDLLELSKTGVTRPENWATLLRLKEDQKKGIIEFGQNEKYLIWDKGNIFSELFEALDRVSAWPDRLNRLLFNSALSKLDRMKMDEHQDSINIEYKEYRRQEGVLTKTEIPSERETVIHETVGKNLTDANARYKTLLESVIEDLRPPEQLP